MGVSVRVVCDAVSEAAISSVKAVSSDVITAVSKAVISEIVSGTVVSEIVVSGTLVLETAVSKVHSAAVTVFLYISAVVSRET